MQFGGGAAIDFCAGAEQPNLANQYGIPYSYM
jgi:hypothetical protein